MATYAVRESFFNATEDTKATDLKEPAGKLRVANAAVTAFDLKNYGPHRAQVHAGNANYAGGATQALEKGETLRMTPAAADTHINIFCADGEQARIGITAV